MAYKLSTLHPEELSPNEYVGEDMQQDDNCGKGKRKEDDVPKDLLSPWEVRKAYRKDPETAQWKKELDQIGAHWVFQLSEEDPDWNLQVGRAWMWAYAGLRICCTKHFAYRRDLDALIDKAMELLEGDIKKYDPAKSTLSKRVNAQMLPRIRDAMRRIGGPRDRDVWKTTLLQLQHDCPENEADRAGWAEDVVRQVFRFYLNRVESKLSDTAKRTSARENLVRRLMAFEPEEMNLETIVKRWVSQVLDGDREDTSIVSLDAFVGEDEESTLGDLLPDPGQNDENQVQQQRSWLAQQAMELAALELNYQALLDPRAVEQNRDHRHNRMCYSERMVYFAMHDALPAFNKRDMYNALLHPYVCFFATMPEGEIQLRLESLLLKTQEEIVDPESPRETWVTPLKWTGKNMFLQPIVPQTYIRRGYGEELTGSEISGIRSDFHKTLNRQLSDRYSREELESIWLPKKKEKGRIS